MTNRSIPMPNTLNVNTRAFGICQSLSKRDKNKLIEIQKYFIKIGVIEKPETSFDEQSKEELEEILQQAVLTAKSEKELNPDYYNMDLDAYLDSIDGSTAAENTLIDDY